MQERADSVVESERPFGSPILNLSRLVANSGEADNGAKTDFPVTVDDGILNTETVFITPGEWEWKMQSVYLPRTLAK